jgi:hypothetical protein
MIKRDGSEVELFAAGIEPERTSKKGGTGPGIGLLSTYHSESGLR